MCHLACEVRRRNSEPEVAKFLGQVDQASQQVLELFDGDAAHSLGAGHLRQQEAHLGLVVGRAHRQQRVERGQDVARHRRDAVDGGLGIPGQEAVRAQAHQHGFKRFGNQVGQFAVDVGARERRGAGVGGQLAQHEQADQDAVGTAMEQGRKGLQRGLGALEVKYLLDLVGRDTGVKMRLQRIVIVLPWGQCFCSQNCTCHYFHCCNSGPC
jgi:hypothetical protein